MSTDLEFLDDDDFGAYEGDDYVPESSCPDCGAIFGPDDTGHCRGGKFGGCCHTFASAHAFDRHLTGKFEPNTRRCRTPEELTAKGWTQGGKYNAWRTPAPASNPWKKQEER